MIDHILSSLYRSDEDRAEIAQSVLRQIDGMAPSDADVANAAAVHAAARMMLILPSCITTREDGAIELSWEEYGESHCEVLCFRDSIEITMARFDGGRSRKSCRRAYDGRTLMFALHAIAGVMGGLSP